MTRRRIAVILVGLLAIAALLWWVSPWALIALVIVYVAICAVLEFQSDEPRGGK